MPNAGATLTFSALSALGGAQSPIAWQMKPTLTLPGYKVSGVFGSTIRGIARISVSFENVLVTASAGQNGIAGKTSLPALLKSSAIQLGSISPNPLTNGSFVTNMFGSAVAVQGPPAWVSLPVLSLGLPNTLAASTNITSVVIPTFYMPHLLISVTSSQAGTLSVQRFVDTGGVVSNGAALTASLTTNTPGIVDNADGKGAGSITINVSNSAATLASLSNINVVLLAR